MLLMNGSSDRIKSGSAMRIVQGKRIKKQARRKKLAFYLSIVTLPILQYCIFYIGVNINSILMAFQSYDAMTGKFYFDGMVNFERIAREFGKNGQLMTAFLNSVKYYGITILVMIMSTFFAFYVAKKRPFSGAFRVVAFMPHIISNITMVLLFKYFTENAYPAIVEAMTGKEVWGLLADPNTVQVTVIVFCILCGFGTQMMMFSNAMSAIDVSVSEAALLDGVTPFKEFLYIDLPIIFPTITTFIIVGIAGIFTNQMSLFSFFGVSADPSVWTLGYYLYKGIKGAAMTEYPYLAALGVLFTLVVVPITFTVRRILNKVDPTA